METIYQENGCKDRSEYLESLSEDYVVDLRTVLSMASILGENEDFDSLICNLEDYAYRHLV